MIQIGQAQGGSGQSGPEVLPTSDLEQQLEVQAASRGLVCRLLLGARAHTTTGLIELENVAAAGERSAVVLLGLRNCVSVLRMVLSACSKRNLHLKRAEQ